MIEDKISELIESNTKLQQTNETLIDSIIDLKTKIESMSAIPAPAKKKRRTKAEIEAEKAAKEAEAKQEAQTENTAPPPPADTTTTNQQVAPPAAESAPPPPADTTPAETSTNPHQMTLEEVKKHIHTYMDDKGFQGVIGEMQKISTKYNYAGGINTPIEQFDPAHYPEFLQACYQLPSINANVAPPPAA